MPAGKRLGEELGRQFEESGCFGSASYGAFERPDMPSLLRPAVFWFGRRRRPPEGSHAKRDEQRGVTRKIMTLCKDAKARVNLDASRR